MGHPHSMYAQRGRGGVKPNAYDCVHGGSGGFQVCVRTQKIFEGGNKMSKLFFFCTKEAITLPFIIMCGKV